MFPVGKCLGSVVLRVVHSLRGLCSCSATHSETAFNTLQQATANCTEQERQGVGSLTVPMVSFGPQRSKTHRGTAESRLGRSCAKRSVRTFIKHQAVFYSSMMVVFSSATAGAQSGHRIRPLATSHGVKSSKRGGAPENADGGREPSVALARCDKSVTVVGQMLDYGAAKFGHLSYHRALVGVDACSWPGIDDEGGPSFSVKTVREIDLNHLHLCLRLSRAVEALYW
jgi:hypothetical protein